MNIPDSETEIIAVLFHPQIIRAIERKVSVCGNVLSPIGFTKTLKRVNFACSLPVEEFGESIRLQMSKWLRQKRMNVICSNFGVTRCGEVEADGTDLLVVHKPSFRKSDKVEKIFTVCTIVHASATMDVILHAHTHAKKLQHILSVTYNVRCRSVVLLCSPNGKVSETWV